ncbi:MAG: DNA repair protein RadA [marine benthic group bacterium]|nr:DNA repair protein RadA [Gemmatimonadota bacterium]
MRWEGKCPSCGAWNTLVEAPAPVGSGGRRARESGSRSGASVAEVSRLGGAAGDVPRPERRPIEFGEVDRVLGGGLVPGSVLLLGGAPGVGKSTLLLQLAGRAQIGGARVLYVSGEESREQVGLRAARLGSGTSELRFVATDRLEEVLAAVEAEAPDLVCIDSIQTMWSGDLTSAPGTVTQVRACSAALQARAKATGAATVLVGHVTKGGALAGPRTLEHLVDVVLHFEGHRLGEHRLLRGSKNRFGSVDELAVFRMTGSGLEPVPDPGGLFIEDRPEGVSGSAVAVPLHGTRPLPAEVQALTATSRYATPQRIATGFPPRRLTILLAVLERRAGLDLGGSDVFLSVIGGLRLTDPAADLAVAAALASASRDRPIAGGTAFAAEIGLGGELRAISHAETRVTAAVRAGFDCVFLPAALRPSLGKVAAARYVATLSEALDLLETE